MLEGSFVLISGFVNKKKLSEVLIKSRFMVFHVLGNEKKLLWKFRHFLSTPRGYLFRSTWKWPYETSLCVINSTDFRSKRIFELKFLIWDYNTNACPIPIKVKIFLESNLLDTYEFSLELRLIFPDIVALSLI